ncbi:MAG: glycosyltransferase [Candidatus Altiarchaeota archaeon]
MGKLKVCMVLPVYNEVEILENSVRTVHDFLMNQSAWDWTIILADNASTDRTLELAINLSNTLKGIKLLHLDQKGRGGALRASWGECDADVFCYSDIDLSVDIKYLPKLVENIVSGSDIVVGSRHKRGASVSRSFRREFFSRGYNLLLKVFFGVGFSDAQCGFKAINRRVLKDIVPAVKDNAFFFDSELLILAERKGYKITELPVKWVEGEHTKVSVIQLIRDYVKNILRLYSEFHNRK